MQLFSRKKNSEADQADAKEKAETSAYQQEREEYVQAVMKETGWSHETALENIKAAKKEDHVGYKSYVRYRYWQLSDEEKKEVQKKLARIRRNKQRVQAVASITGWSNEQAKADMQKVKNELGVGFKDYVLYQFFELNDEERVAKAQGIQRRSVSKNRNEDERVRKVAAAMGCSEQEAREKMDECKARTGAHYRNYLSYRMWEMDEDMQAGCFNNGHVQQLSRKYITHPENAVYFKSKVLFNKTFAEFTGRPWLSTHNITLESFKETLGACSKLIYKPNSSSCGNGVQVFEMSEHDPQELVATLQALPSGIVERFVVQHPEMAKWSGGVSLNTLRVITILDNNECCIPYAIFRMGGGTAPVDNLYFGGVLVPVDVETGVTWETGIDINGKDFAVHPNCGLPVGGFTIPFWKEAKDMLDKACRVVEGVGFIGWDVAITTEGPILIEGNTYPAANNVQLPFVSKRIPMRPRFDRFLRES